MENEISNYIRTLRLQKEGNINEFTNVKAASQGYKQAFEELQDRLDEVRAVRWPTSSRRSDGHIGAMGEAEEQNSRIGDEVQQLSQELCEQEQGTRRRGRGGAKAHAHSEPQPRLGVRGSGLRAVTRQRWLKTGLGRFSPATRPSSV